MTVEELQARVDGWISQFEEGYFPPQVMMLRLTEELGELAREVNHQFGPKPKKPDEAESSVALEIGDLLFVLASFANSLGIDLAEAFSMVMEKFERRDADRWTKKTVSPQDG
jgi:NTP pyrophosphatase (non-canonical NTP hydrolase)